MPVTDVRNISTNYKVNLVEPSEGSPIMLTSAVVIGAGQLVMIDDNGKAALADGVKPSIGFSLKNAPANSMVTVVERGIVEQIAGTALALVPGQLVYTGTAGEYSKTGTAAKVVGVALTASKIRVKL